MLSMYLCKTGIGVRLSDNRPRDDRPACAAIYNYFNY